MPFSLTITADSAEQLRFEARALAEAFGAQTLPAETSAPIKAAEDDKPTVGKAAAKSKPKASKAEPEPKAEEPPAEKPKAEAAPLDFDKDVAPMVVRLVTEKGRDVTQGLLDEYGVARASQISDDMLPEFLEKVEEALAS